MISYLRIPNKLYVVDFFPQQTFHPIYKAKYLIAAVVCGLHCCCPFQDK